MVVEIKQPKKNQISGTLPPNTPVGGTIPVLCACAASERRPD